MQKEMGLALDFGFCPADEETIQYSLKEEIYGEQLAIDDEEQPADIYFFKKLETKGRVGTHQTKRDTDDDVELLDFLHGLEYGVIDNPAATPVNGFPLSIGGDEFPPLGSLVDGDAELLDALLLALDYGAIDNPRTTPITGFQFSTGGDGFSPIGSLEDVDFELMDALGMDYDMDATPITDFSVSTENEFLPLGSLEDGMDAELLDALLTLDYDVVDNPATTPITGFPLSVGGDEFTPLGSLEDVDFGLMDAMGMDYDMDATPITDFTLSTEDEFPPLGYLEDGDVELIDALLALDYGDIDNPRTPPITGFSLSTGGDGFSPIGFLEDVDFGLMDAMGMDYDMDTTPITDFPVSTKDEFPSQGPLEDGDAELLNALLALDYDGIDNPAATPITDFPR